MLESHPPRMPGLIMGVALAVGLVLLDVLVVSTLLNAPVTLLSFGLGLVLLLSVPALFAVGYLVRGLQQARYRIDDDTLIVDWRGFTQRIPLSQIRHVLAGRDLDTVRHFRGVRMPGLILGRGQAVLAGEPVPLRVYATRGPALQVVLQTDRALIAVSPMDPENFLACVHALKGTAAPSPSFGADASPAADPFWRDSLARWLLLVSVLLNVALFAYLSAVFPRLPDLVPLRFGPGGQIMRAGAPLQLFSVPVLALFGWLLNGGLGLFFYRWQGERLTAYLLWAAGGGLQVAAWIGLVGLTRF